MDYSLVDQPAPSTPPPAYEPAPLPVRSGLSPLIAALVPPVGALLLTWLFMAGPVAQSGEGEFFARLFLPSGPRFLGWVPQATILVFFWVLLDLAIKFIAQSRQRLAHLRLETALRGARAGMVFDHRAAEQVLRQVQHEDLERTLGPLAERRPVAESLEFFRHRIELDGEAAEGRYATAHLFVWAMPILGFIGTVLGIGIAVGGFSGFLKTDIDDIELVKAGLAGVAGGLAFAFDTTLLGLAGSLIAMIGTSILQRRELDFVARVEAFGLEIAAALPVQAATRPSPTLSGFPEELGSLDAMLSAEAHRIEAACLATVEALGRSLNPLSAAMHSLPSGLETHGQMLMNGIDQATLKLRESQASLEARDQQSVEALAALASSVATIAASQEVQLRATLAVEALARDVASSHEILTRLIDHQERIARTLQRFESGIHLRLDGHAAHPEPLSQGAH